MKRTALTVGSAFASLLLDATTVVAQETSAIATEGRTIGQLLIAALSAASVTVVYVVATRVRTRRHPSRHV